MKINIETITPLHIGTGKKISPFEYVLEDNKFVKINSKKFFEFLSDDEKNNLLKAYNSNNLPYIRYETLKAYNTLTRDIKEKLKIYSLDVDETFEKVYNLKIGDRKQHNEANRLEIEEAIKNLDGFYIPGSSLKGTIRTIILFSLIKGKEENIKNLKIFNKNFNDIKNIKDNNKKIKQIRFRSRSDTNNLIEQEVLNFDKIWQDPFRFLIVRDSKIIPFENGVVVKNYRLGQRGKLHTTKEYIKTNSLIETEIIFNNKQFNLFKEKLDLDYNLGFDNENDFKEFFIKSAKLFLEDRLYNLKKLSEEKINKLSNGHINRGKKAEIQMFEKLLKNIEYIETLENSLAENEVIVNLGFGGGYIFKKLDDLLISETYNFVGNELLNGFIKLTFKD